MDLEEQFGNSCQAYTFLYFQQLPGTCQPFSNVDFHEDAAVVELDRQEQERDRRIRQAAGVKAERFYLDSGGGLELEMQFDRQGRIISSEDWGAIDYQEPDKREPISGTYRTWQGEGDTLASLRRISYHSIQDQALPRTKELIDYSFDQRGNIVRIEHESEFGKYATEMYYDPDGLFSHSFAYRVEGDDVERAAVRQVLRDEGRRPILVVNGGEGLDYENGYAYDEEGRLIQKIYMDLGDGEGMRGYGLPGLSPHPLQGAALRLAREGAYWKPKPGSNLGSEDRYRYYQGRLAFIDRFESKGNLYFPRRAYYYDDQGHLLRELYRQRPDYLSSVYLHEYDAAGRRTRNLLIDGRLSDEIDWDQAAILPEHIVSLKKERNEYDYSFTYDHDGALVSIRCDSRVSTMAPIAKVDTYHPDGRPKHVWSATFKKKSVQASESFYEYDDRQLLTHVRTRHRKEEDHLRVERDFYT